MSLQTTDLLELLAKYEEILRLRELHARTDEPNPRTAMVNLAARYPGALRELDALPLHEIRDRIDQIGSATRGEGPILPWMVAIYRFHVLARSVLAAKRLLSQTPSPASAPHRIDAARASRMNAQDQSPSLLEQAGPWCHELARVAAPPRGRLMDLVYERLARDLGTEVEDAKKLTFGTSRTRGSLDLTGDGPSSGAPRSGALPPLG